MPISEMEWLWLLKDEGMSDLDIAERTGGSERTIRSIKKTTGRKPSAFEEGINQTGIEIIELPWPNEAHWQARRITELIRSDKLNELYKSFAFTSNICVTHLRKLDKDDIFSEEDWGCAIIAFLFLMGMQLSRLTHHARYRKDDSWDFVVEMLLELLSGRDENWANLLKYKVSGNYIVIRWKNLSPRGEDRSSDEIKSLLEKFQYREHLIAFSDLIPSDSVAPFNALAIASRLHDRDNYPDLLKRLQIADRRYQDIDNITDPEFDDDFDDFRCWYKSSFKGAA